MAKSLDHESHSEAWTHGWTDERTERLKLYTPRHTLYALMV